MTAVRVVVYRLTGADDSGQVTVYQKGTALQEQVTDEKGDYLFSLEPGAYVVEVWVNDQKVGNRLVKVEPGRSATTDFQVESPSP
jgi:hypothetical protein